MSKSKGNVVDPLVIMDKYGTDAFRFTLTALTSQGRDICLDEKRIEGYRHFINKIWNASRFSLMNLEDFTPGQFPPEKLEYSLADKWILSRLQRVIAETNAALEEYRFNDLAHTLYQFFWHEFCDWYLELAKLRLTDTSVSTQQRYSTQFTLWRVLQESLRLLHPIIPFVTEEIWQHLPKEKPAAEEPHLSIMGTPWPEVNKSLIKQEVEDKMVLLQDIITTIRNLRSDLKLPPAQTLPQVLISPNNSASPQTLQAHEGYIRHLTRTVQIKIEKQTTTLQTCVSGIGRYGEVFIPLTGVLDIEQETQRLKKAVQQVQKELKVVEGKLASPSFLEKAPAHIITKENQKQAQMVEKLRRLETNLARLAP